MLGDNTPSYNDLLEAIKQGSLKHVRCLLGESGITEQGYLREVDPDGCTLLHHAVLNYKSKSDNIIKFLVEKRGSVSSLTITNNQGCTPLQLAIRKHPLLPAGTIKSLFRAYLHSSNDTPFEQYQLLEKRDFKTFTEKIPDLFEHVNKPDAHGFTALHYAVLYNAPATIVKTLIQWSEPDIDPILSLTPKEPLPTIFPLHLAILAPMLERWNTPSEYNIKCLLAAEKPVNKLHLADDTVNKSPLAADNAVNKALFSIFCQLDDKGKRLENTPLHLAVSYKCSAAIIEDLVNADASGSKESQLVKKSIVTQNSRGQYPLQVAIKKRLPKNVIEVLLKADWSSNGETRFSVLSEFIHGYLPNQYVPLIINDHILSHLRFPFEIPPEYFSNLAEKPMFQHSLNERWCITYAFAYLLFFDLYIYMLGLICFMLQWEREEVVWAFRLLCIISLLLIAREVVEMICSGIIRWVKTPRHLLHLAYAVLLIYCNFVIKLDAKTEHSKNQRNTILLTGGLAWIMPILPLSTAFLPIALFVSGVLNIMQKLIPFLIISFLLLGSYAAMFQVDSLNEQESFNICGANVSLADPPMCPFWDSFANVSYLVLGGVDSKFLSSPSAPATIGLLVSFAILAVIVFLNVVIAIINLSWNEVTREGHKVFWSERARYLELSLDSLKDDKEMSRIDKAWRRLIECPDSWNVFTPLILVINRLAVIVWLVYGLFTFGILWPTCVQKFLQNKGGCLYRAIRRFYRSVFVDQADDSLDDPLEKLWEKLIENFYLPNRDEESFGGQILYLLNFLAAILLLCSWLLLGFLFGLLWPRQVRKKIFCPPIKDETKKREDP